MRCVSRSCPSIRRTARSSSGIRTPSSTARPGSATSRPRAPRIFRDYLLSDGAADERCSSSASARPTPATPLGTPIEPANGANPEATLVPLTVPDTLAIDRVGEVWQDVRKHAVDRHRLRQVGRAWRRTSKINCRGQGCPGVRARDEPPGRVCSGSPSTRPSIRGVRGTKAADRRAAHRRHRGHDRRGRDGPLRRHPAGLARSWKTQRAVTGDTVRYGIVVLSDGQDQNSVQTLSQLEAALATTRSRPDRHPDPYHRHRRGRRRGDAQEDRPGGPRAVLEAQERRRGHRRLQGHRRVLLGRRLGPLSALRRGWAWVVSSPHCGATANFFFLRRSEDVRNAADQQFTGSVEGIQAAYAVDRDRLSKDFRGLQEAVAQVLTIAEDKKIQLERLGDEEQRLQAQLNGAINAAEQRAGEQATRRATPRPRRPTCATRRG